MIKKRLSTCTVEELNKFIADTVIGDSSKWYVMINGKDHTIDLVNPKTLEINEIKAAQIHYRG